MKKYLALFLAIVLTLLLLTACGGGASAPVDDTAKDYETAKTIITNYARATLNAWKQGLNEKTMYKGKDNGKANDFDFDNMVELTGFDKAKMEEIVMEDTGYTDFHAVSKYSNKFQALHDEGRELVVRANIFSGLNGTKSYLTKDEYLAIVQNLEMVKYFYEKLYKDDLEKLLSNNSGENFENLKELKKYIEGVFDGCFSMEHNEYFELTYLFESNYRTVSDEIKTFCSDKLDVLLQLSV